MEVIEPDKKVPEPGDKVISSQVIKSIENINPKVELKISIDINSRIEWSVPGDVKMTSYLYRMLGIAIDRMITQGLQAESKPQLVKPGMFSKFLHK